MINTVKVQIVNAVADNIKKTRMQRVEFMKVYYAAISLAEHISGRLALTSASANGGGTALPHRATCLSLAYFTPR
jgi:hypothetical protein